MTQRSRSPARTRVAVLENGPITYSEMHRWPAEAIARLAKKDLQLGQNLQGHIHFTTHFSGMGTAEHAAGIGHSFLEDAGLLPAQGPHFHMHSACDYKPLCQHLLQSSRMSQGLQFIAR